MIETSVMKELRNILENEDLDILCKTVKLCEKLYKMVKITLLLKCIFDS